MNNLKNRKVQLLIGAFILLAAIGMAAVVLNGAGGRDGALAQIPLAAVKQGPLTISVTESGTITARDQVILKSEVEGSTTIIYLVPEGQHVKAGELLIELDASSMEDELLDDQIDAQNAEAAFIRARENLEVVKNQAESDLKDAELNYALAQMDLKKYIEGEYPNQVREAESKITLAEEELERATEKVTWSERLFSEKYISQTELESDRLSKNRAQLDFELATASLDLLTEFTHARRIAELENAVTQTEMALERVRRRATSDVVQAEADLRAKEAENEQDKKRLEETEEQLKKTKIYAPIDGMVIYASSAGGGGWRGNDDPLAEGQTVRERQELIHLPTAAAMIAEVKVHESNLQKISVGLPVSIRVDALPGKEFQGRVKKIAPLPDSQSVWLNPDLKVYNTQIEITGTADGLRTGMTCRAEIVVDRYSNVKYIPLQAVVRVANTPTVYQLKGESMQPKAIEVGLDNNRMIHVVAGLNSGEQVVLTPPIASSANEEEVQEQVTETESTETESAPATKEAEAEEPAAAEANTGAEELRNRFENMSEDERNAMRERFQNMSEEERQKLRQQFQGGGQNAQGEN